MPNGTVIDVTVTSSPDLFFALKVRAFLSSVTSLISS